MFALPTLKVIGDKNDPELHLALPLCAWCVVCMHLLCAHDHALYAQDQCGFVQWRPCFYVVAPIDNFIYMLDGFWKYLGDAMAKETKLEVHLWTASDVNIDDTSTPQSDRAS